MPNIVPFYFDTYQVRIELDDKGEPWWIAQDVCAVLAIKNVSNAVGRLLSGEKRIRVADKQLIINESGLYRMIFRSDKKTAQRFQNWVFEEVLPQIRKFGNYEPTRATPQVKNPANQLLIDTVIRLDDVEQRALAAEQRSHEAEASAAQANANAARALETQLFFTVAEYVYIHKLAHQLPENAYKACSDHLRLYCLDRNIPFRKQAVGGKHWQEEYAFHESVYTDVLPDWLKRRYAQATLHVIHTSEEAESHA